MIKQLRKNLKKLQKHIVYQIQRKQNYDNFGHAAFENIGGGKGFGNFDFSGSFSDIFEDFFGEGFGGGGRRSRRSNNRGSDLRYDLSITLEEAYTGKKQDIKFSTSEKVYKCNGSGSKPGHSASSCSMCGGHGQVRSSQGFLRFSKHVRNVQGSGEQITDPCTIVEDKVKSKLIKDFQ